MLVHWRRAKAYACHLSIGMINNIVMWRVCIPFTSFYVCDTRLYCFTLLTNNLESIVENLLYLKPVEDVHTHWANYPSQK